MRTEILFRGMVQGVGFRATAAEVARRFKVTGWVRNEADSSVKMVLEGDADEIERCLDALREKVGDKIRSEEAESTEAERGYDGFEIR